MQKNTPSHLPVDHTFSGNSTRFLLHIDEDARGPSALRALFAFQNSDVVPGFTSPCRFIAAKSYQAVDTEQRMSWLNTCASETFLSPSSLLRAASALLPRRAKVCVRGEMCRQG